MLKYVKKRLLYFCKYFSNINFRGRKKYSIDSIGRVFFSKAKLTKIFINETEKMTQRRKHFLLIYKL